MTGKRIKPEDVLGKRFGSWTVLGRRENGKYLCRCDCGYEIAKRGYELKRGIVYSCGCTRRPRKKEVTECQSTT